MKPVFNKNNAFKVMRYFLNQDGIKKHKTIIIGVRHKKINRFDDESFTYNVREDSFITNNFNTDPSIYREKGKGVAILRPGVHYYRISYHHTNDNSKRYIALRPNTPDESLPVFRYDAKGNFTLSIGFAINIHAGGDITTGSRGCQTLPRGAQFREFINFIGKSEGVSIPSGIITKSKIGDDLFNKFKKGIGNICYILVNQEQYDYIIKLDEADFDNEADLRYQMKNFVNKIERVAPKLAPAVNPSEILLDDKLEDEEIEDLTLDDLDEPTPDEPTPDNSGESSGDQSGGMTQKADNIINQGEANQQAKIDAAEKLDDTEIQPTKTGILPKLLAFFGISSLAEIDWMNPSYLEIFKQFLNSIWEMRYLILIGLLVWYIGKKLAGVYLTKKIIETNTDPERGNVKIIPDQKEGLIPVIRKFLGM